jgi:uncharacterized membrane protein YfcA
MKIRDLDLEATPINLQHQQLGLPPLELAITHPAQHPVLRIFGWLAALLLLGALAYLAQQLLLHSGSLSNAGGLLLETLNSPVFWSAAAVGLFAQVVDGALGMAYGITSTTFLLAAGQSPAVASASVHIAEVFTTGLSGLSHLKLKNICHKLFLRLLLPGITGALLGAYLVTHIDGKQLKPFISVYLLLMGLYIISKVWGRLRAAQGEPKHVGKLALLGGFVDSVGGGGWGPVVTTTLIGKGHDPRTTIGSVNFAEFFLAFGSAIAFSLLIEETPWVATAKLIWKSASVIRSPANQLCLARWSSMNSMAVFRLGSISLASTGRRACARSAARRRASAGAGW